jgi:hypothetical protein
LGFVCAQLHFFGRFSPRGVKAPPFFWAGTARNFCEFVWSPPPPPAAALLFFYRVFLAFLGKGDLTTTATTATTTKKIIAKKYCSFVFVLLCYLGVCWQGI